MLATVLLRINFFVVAICLAASFRLLFRPQVPIHLKVFPIFLVITLIFQIVGHKMQQVADSNHVVFNIFSIISFPFCLFVLWRILDKGYSKLIALYAMLFFPIVAIINMVYVQGVDYFNTYTHSLGAVLIVMLSINCLYQLFIKTPSKVSPMHLPDFWICMGLLVFYSVTFVGFNAMQAGITHSAAALQIIGIILILSQYFLYINFTIGFYCALNQPPTDKIIPDNQDTFSP